MYNPQIRVEPHGDIAIHELVSYFGIDYNQSFDTVEEMTEYIEGLILGTSDMLPFIRGVAGYETDANGQLVVTRKTIIGAKRLNAIGRYLKGEFSLSDCKYIPELSQKSYDELPRRLQRRLDTVIVKYFTVEWTGKDTDYEGIADMLKRQFGYC